MSPPARTLLLELASVLTRLAAIGFLAIGLSGLLAGLFGALFGETFVAGDAPGVTYTQARCADYFEYQPGSRTCEQAATLHHYGEVVDYRVAAGILGLLVLAGYLLAHRRGWTATPNLPQGFAATIGVGVFGLAAAGLLLQSLNQFVLGETAGVGGYLSGGVVSLVVACGFGLSLFRLLFKRSEGVPSR
ncbi:MAG: hypothetical protein M3O88_04635 [Actinomycetota bacterium]|nr:hypothetical protein [Actinomycetota bacterium]